MTSRRVIEETISLMGEAARVIRRQTCCLDYGSGERRRANEKLDYRRGQMTQRQEIEETLDRIEEAVRAIPGQIRRIVQGIDEWRRAAEKLARTGGATGSVSAEPRPQDLGD